GIWNSRPHPTSRMPTKAEERCGITDLEGSPEKSVEQLKGAEIHPDPQTEDQKGAEGKTKRMPQRPDAEAHISPEIVEPIPTPNIARLFAEPKRVAELFRLAHHQPVRFHFPAQLAFQSPAIQQIPNASQPFHR